MAIKSESNRADPELDFGGPSHSFYFLFHMGSFLAQLFPIRNTTV